MILFGGDHFKLIRGILESKCLDCHDEDKPKARFRVDGRAFLLKGGDSGLPGIVPGEPARSHLLELVKSKDEDERMPRKGNPLSAREIAVLEKWIVEGAVCCESRTWYLTCTIESDGCSRGYTKTGWRRHPKVDIAQNSKLRALLRMVL